MYNKPIIVFEGIEASGKSSHIKFVANYLKSKKLGFIMIREPGGNYNSEKIRKLILSDNSDFNKITDLYLYLASRSENIDKVIKKNYNKKIILIDRFIDSTVAYQHYGMGLNKRIIDINNKFILDKLKISFTFLNIVNKKNLLIRLKKRSELNRYDKFKTNFYTKAQNGFIKISKKNKNKYLIINSNLELTDNKSIVINKIKKLLNIK
jgi:dTMP kinase